MPGSAKRGRRGGGRREQALFFAFAFFAFVCVMSTSLSIDASPLLQSEPLSQKRFPFLSRSRSPSSSRRRLSHRHHRRNRISVLHLCQQRTRQKTNRESVKTSRHGVDRRRRCCRQRRPRRRRRLDHPPPPADPHGLGARRAPAQQGGQGVRLFSAAKLTMRAKRESVAAPRRPLKS